MKKFFDEFKQFIMRGNVLNLAVGVIIGAAFQAIVTSLTNDIISPILGIFGGMNFDELSVTINGAVIAYGKFITAVINFLIMGFYYFSHSKACRQDNVAWQKAKGGSSHNQEMPVLF